MADLRAVREEVRLWNAALLERPQLIVASKRDAVSDPDPLPDLLEEGRRLGLEVVPISAVSHAGLDALKRRLAERVLVPVPAEGA